MICFSAFETCAYAYVAISVGGTSGSALGKWTSIIEQRVLYPMKGKQREFLYQYMRKFSANTYHHVGRHCDCSRPLTAYPLRYMCSCVCTYVLFEKDTIGSMGCICCDDPSRVVRLGNMLADAEHQISTYESLRAKYGSSSR